MPHFASIPEIEPSMTGGGLKIAIVMARFNPEVCQGLLSACVGELKNLGVGETDLFITSVPGALEVPLALQVLAKSGRFDALVALGAVIRGETYHFELVANESGSGITQVGLDTGVPIANAILTTEDDAQALARMQPKGVDAARVAVEMACLQAALRTRLRG